MFKGICALVLGALLLATLGDAVAPSLRAPAGTFYLVGFPEADDGGMNCFYFDFTDPEYNATSYQLDFYTEQDLMYYSRTMKNRGNSNPFKATLCINDRSGITEIGQYILLTAYLDKEFSYPANITQIDPPASFGF